MLMIYHSDYFAESHPTYWTFSKTKGNDPSRERPTTLFAQP